MMGINYYVIIIITSRMFFLNRIDFSIFNYQISIFNKSIWREYVAV